MAYTYKNIKKTYQGRLVLDIDELRFDTGIIYGIRGFNGSGKSTLCKILAKIETPDTAIVYPDIDVGYMPQASYVFDMSVMKNMLLNEENPSDKKKASELLSLFNLSKYENTNARCLSGGEKQKLCLARLMLKRYDMLILDEPTSSMDYDSTILTDNLIVDYAKKNDSIVIMVSHEEDELKRMKAEIIRFEKGKIVSM